MSEGDMKGDGATRRWVDRDEQPIAWRESAHARQGAEPVIFLHAMAGSRTAFNPQLDALSGNYRCIVWDMPGFGTSLSLHGVDCARDGGMARVIDQLVAFVRTQLNLPAAHFIGLSVGGMILQHLAATYPTLVRSITVMDSSPKFGFGGDMRPQDFADPILQQLRDGTSVAQFSDTMIRAIVGPGCSESIKCEAIASMSRASTAGLALATRLISQHDALDRLGLIKCPTLVMAGEHDAETPPAYAAAIAARIQGAELAVIPDAGHLVNLEAPEAVNAKLAAFLAAHR